MSTLPALLTRLRLRPFRKRFATPPARSLRTRRSSRATLAWFVLALLGINAVMMLVTDGPRIRDPEYGLRATHLRERLAENPGRPLVLVVGSSRVAMGIRPSEWEAIRPADPQTPDPLLFNMAILGGGPITELLALRRAYADGFRPAVVLIEYWAPYLHQDGEWAETKRFQRDRLIESDRQTVREYFPEPDRVERDMNWRVRNPIFANRERLLVQILPRWVPAWKRSDWMWDDMDQWGWKPGFDLPFGPTPERTDYVGRCTKLYDPLFAAYRIAPEAEQALRDAVSLAREHGAAVAFTVLPESSEFRKLYPPHVEQQSQTHLRNLSRELNVPVLNCREWLNDGFVVDGFHLSRIGAAEFTRKFGPAIAATFPNLSREAPAQVKP